MHMYCGILSIYDILEVYRLVTEQYTVVVNYICVSSFQL